MRALKASGKKRLDSYQVEQEADLYEEVDEAGYKKVVRERLNQDDFVIDDNGEGYADDGREEWDRQPEYESGSEEELPVRGKAGKIGQFGLPSGIGENMPANNCQQNANGKKTRPRRRKLRRESVITSRKVL